MNYDFIVPKLEERLPGVEDFWQLKSKLRYVPPVPCGRGSNHRWGTLSIAFKQKSLVKIPSGEIKLWKDLKVRPILGYHRHFFRRWYTLACRAMNFMAKTHFQFGQGVLSNAKVLHRLGVFDNWAFFHGTRPPDDEDHLEFYIGDIEAFYNNLERDDVTSALREGARRFQAQRRNYI